MPKRKKVRKDTGTPLDSILGKRARGRPGVVRSEIVGRADNYRGIFTTIWNTVGKELLQAKSKEDVIKAIELEAHYKSEFSPIAGLILKVLREKKFPKTQEAQINFLADSLAGREGISARRSRDICDAERKKPKNYIIRQDFYIECSCGYEGPAYHKACPKCGAVSLDLTGFLSFLDVLPPAAFLGIAALCTYVTLGTTKMTQEPCSRLFANLPELRSEIVL